MRPVISPFLCSCIHPLAVPESLSGYPVARAIVRIWNPVIKKTFIAARKKAWRMVPQRRRDPGFYLFVIIKVRN
jgi:hypothetical protein